MNTVDQGAAEFEISEHLAKLDKLLEHRSRFAICALLKRYDKVAFSRFKELLGETDGNLGAQLRKLEDSGYINVNKEFQDRRPVSWYTLTDVGQKALLNHLSGLEALIS